MTPLLDSLLTEQFINSKFRPCNWLMLNIITGIMITASHQTFSGQIKHLSNQTKFGQTNLATIAINENFIEVAKKCLDNF